MYDCANKAHSEGSLIGVGHYSNKRQRLVADKTDNNYGNAASVLEAPNGSIDLTSVAVRVDANGWARRETREKGQMKPFRVTFARNDGVSPVFQCKSSASTRQCPQPGMSARYEHSLFAARRPPTRVGRANPITVRRPTGKVLRRRQAEGRH